MCVFCKIKHFFTLFLSTLYLSLVPYRSTDTQTRSFLKKNPELSVHVGISSIPSKNTDRKITIPSGKHSFTLYPSLSPYNWTDRQTEWQTENKYTRCAWAGGTFFPANLLLCQFFGSGGQYFLVLLTYLVYNTAVVLCQFFGSGG